MRVESQKIYLFLCDTKTGRNWDEKLRKTFLLKLSNLIFKKFLNKFYQIFHLKFHQTSFLNSQLPHKKFFNKNIKKILIFRSIQLHFPHGTWFCSNAAQLNIINSNYKSYNVYTTKIKVHFTCVLHSIVEKIYIITDCLYE